MNTNVLDFSDYDRQSVSELQEMKFLDFESIQQRSTSNNSFNDIKTTKSFDEISNEIALRSPFGNKSLLYTELDGKFVDYTIDKEYLLQKIIEHSTKKDIMKYDLVAFNLGIVSNFSINNVEYNVKTELNTLSGRIDFSKQPSFRFNFSLKEQISEYKILYEFINFKNSSDNNRIAIILTFYNYSDLEVFLDKLDKVLVKEVKSNIKEQYIKAFEKSKGQSEVLDFLFATAPDFVINSLKDTFLLDSLNLLSSHRIDTIGTNENISIINPLCIIKRDLFLSC